MGRTLTAEQLQRYHEDGFVLVEDVFDPAELAAMDAELDAFRASEKFADHRSAGGGGGPGWVMALGLATESTRAFCEDERILDLIEPIVHPGIAIYSAKLVSKEPFEGTRCHWHQDDAYYTRHSQSACRMSVWIPLSDTTIEQGALQVIPGSHRRGLQPASMRPDGTCSLAMDVEVDLSERVYVPVRAGTMVLFSALLWHASDGNRTARRRRAFIVSYQEATAAGGNGRQWKILREADA